MWIKLPGWWFLWIIVRQSEGLRPSKNNLRDFWPSRQWLRFWHLYFLIYNGRCDSRDLWPLWHLFRVMRWPDLTKKNFAMLWHLRHWLQYRQLRTWINDNLCYLTINCDTGQHSQFLRCLKSNNTRKLNIVSVSRCC